VSEFAFDERVPLSFSAAPPGWRALYVNPDDNSQHFTYPIIGCALYRISVRDNDTNQPLPTSENHRIEGVVLEGRLAMSAEDYSDLWWYLAPDQPDPEPGTVPSVPSKPGKRRPTGLPTRRRSDTWSERAG
jgi:hypothetical protein